MQDLSPPWAEEVPGGILGSNALMGLICGSVLVGMLGACWCGLQLDKMLRIDETNTCLCYSKIEQMFYLDWGMGLIRTEIVTLKIKRRYMDLIVHGVKRFEVRDESLASVNFVHYIDSVTLESLGVYSVARTFCLTRDHDVESIQYAAIECDDFYRLFPNLDNGGPVKLWIAELGAPVDLLEVLGGSVYGDHERGFNQES